jgi:hypothetical protein
MKSIWVLILLSMILCSCGVSLVSKNQRDLAESKQWAEQYVAKVKQQEEQHDAEINQKVQQALIKDKEREQQRESDEKRLCKSMESTAKRLAKSTKKHSVEPINGSDLEEWREALKIGGYSFHPLNGTYTFSGDVTVIELYCLDDYGKRVFVDTSIIGGKTIVNMHPRYVRISD